MKVLKLCECKIEECVGLRVWNYKKTQLGTVTSVIRESDNLHKNIMDRVRWDTVIIDWDNGNRSVQFLMNLDLSVENKPTNL